MRGSVDGRPSWSAVGRSWHARNVYEPLPIAELDAGSVAAVVKPLRRAERGRDPGKARTPLGLAVGDRHAHYGPI